MQASPTREEEREAGSGTSLHDVSPVIALEQQHRSSLRSTHRFAHMFTRFHASLWFAILQATWIGAWIVFNLGWPATRPFDPYPFNLLSLVVGIEVLILSTVVLISQSRQTEVTERRAKVALQVTTLIEQETTKLLEMMAQIQEQMGIQHLDPRAAALQEPTNITRLAEAIDAAEQEFDE